MMMAGETRIHPPQTIKAEMEMIILAFISSRLDYCNTLFTRLNQTSLKSLQSVQNTPA